MNERTLLSGQPVPADYSHTEINPSTGMQRDYVVLSAEERAKGFVKPVRRSYVHQPCGTVTTMGRSLAETYARDPRFYSGTFCVGCRAHFALDEFEWEDGEPMKPDLRAKAEWRSRRIEELRRELAELEGGDV